MKSLLFTLKHFRQLMPSAGASALSIFIVTLVYPNWTLMTSSGLRVLFCVCSVSQLPSPPCQRCHGLADQLRASFKEIESLRDERDAQRDCHNILTQQLEFQQRKLDARDALQNQGQFRVLIFRGGLGEVPSVLRFV